MVELREIEERLARVGLRNKFWGKPEVRELCHIIHEDEEITGAVNGRHEGGFALLVATDRRLLLVDKKLMFLMLEDIRYEMISQVDYFAHLQASTLSISTISKSLKFTSMRQSDLRSLTSFVQQQVMSLRQFQNQPELPSTQEDPSRGYLMPSVSPMPQIQNFRRTARPTYPGASLTVRRRVSRFYPSS